MKRIVIVLLLLAPLALAGCSLDNILNKLVNQIPEAVIDASPQQGHAPLTVAFDAHYSHDDGALAEFHWDFGDPHNTPPASSATATHTFQYPGTYLVKLTVIDNKGELDTEKLAIVVTNPPPIASFEASNDMPAAGDPVTFDASASYDSNGGVTSYLWDYGDGNTGNGVETNHVYTEDGYYVVSLTVTDNEGETGTARLAIIAQEAGGGDCCGSGGSCGGGGNDKPLAVISNMPGCAGVKVGTPITLDGSCSRAAEGTIVRYKWDFGDGETAVGAIVTHTYQQTGRFRVTLTVNDDSGNQATAYGSPTIYVHN
jgi:PKD repeat protein